jgi:gamma-glutamyltranspeptidase/glutathione hydrolase
MTKEDLSDYRPTWREPIRARYRKLEVLPPPSSGGICIAETLNILENWPLGEIHQRDPGLAAHLSVEAVKHAFADRARHLGDADFAPVPVAKLTHEAYAAELARRIREDGVSAPRDYGWRVPEDAGTTHFCVADQWGNVVAATETINTGFGSLVLAEGTGVVLNNEMDDFTAEPGKRNAFGLVQSPLNEVAPGRRPLSSMSPTIVLARGKPVLAVGAAGGPRIITATLQVLLNVVEYGLPVEDAISKPRWHHQWDPDVVYANRFTESDPVVTGLRQRGHKVSDKSRDATVQALQIRDAGYIGACDPGKGGRPAGY